MANTLGGGKARLSFEVTDSEISAGKSELSNAEQGSQLVWHAITSVVPITNEMLMNPPPPRVISGKALLKNGIVTFAIMQAPKDRFDSGYAGPVNKKYLDGLVGSLTLFQPQ